MPFYTLHRPSRRGREGQSAARAPGAAVGTVGRAGKVVRMSEKAATSIRSFIAAHGGAAKAVLQPVGLRGVRITLVGADGIMGDEMVDSMADAQAVVEAVPELTTSDWDRDLVATATPAPGHVQKMAGWSGRGL